MKTQPFDTPIRGMLVFNVKANLAATVGKVTGKDFDFHVHSGCWDGTYADGTILVHETEQLLMDQEDFEEIVALTKDDIDRWYLDRCHRAGQLLKGYTPLDVVPEPEDDEDFDDEIPF